MEPVPTCSATCTQAKHIGIDNIISKQHQQPVNRSHKLYVTVTPAHTLGNRQGRERFSNDIWQQINHRRTLLVDIYREPGAFVGADFFNISQLHTTGFCKPECCLSRLTVLVGRGQCRSAALDFLILLLYRYCINNYSKPSGGCVNTTITCRKISLFQTIGDSLTKSIGKC